MTDPMDWYLSLRLECKLDVDMKIEMIISDGSKSVEQAIAIIYSDKVKNDSF